MKGKNIPSADGQNGQNLFVEELQRELEKLSWEFLLKEKDDQASKASGVIEKNKADEAGDNSKDEKKDEVNEYYNQRPVIDYQNFDFWKNEDEANINNLRRDSGIIFNEEKLKAHKVVEWTKAPRLKDPKFLAFGRVLSKIFLTPFNLMITVFVGTTTVIGKSVIAIGEIIYKTLKSIVVVGWQIVVAFKYVFIYLFGDFSWLKRQELATEFIAIEEKVQSFIPRYVSENRRWRAMGAFVVVAMFLILPLQGYLFFNRAEKIKGEVLGASEQGVAHLWQAGLAGKNMDMQSAGREFVLAGQEFMRAQNDFKELGLVANSAASVVPEIKAGDQLLTVAIKSAEIGHILAETGQAMSEFAQKIDYQSTGIEIEGNNAKVKIAGNGESINWLTLKTELDRAVTEAVEIENIIQNVDLSNSNLASYKEQFQIVKNQIPRAVGLLKNYRDLTKIVTGFLGVDEPKRWLMVFQNNAEIRPTGGFMGSYAVVDIKNGKIKNIIVPGGGFYDLKGSLAVHVDTPYPFHVFSPIWQPWNANWFPDWPASAQKIMWFYDKSGGSSVDGVISFTPDVLEGLLKLTGPIEMPEYDLTVDSDNFMRTAQTQVEFNYDKIENKPKKFIGDLLPKVLEKIFMVEGEQRIVALETIFTSLQEKNILIYFKDQDNQDVADKFGWSGRIAQYDKDYLAIIHTNIVGGKTDRVVENKVEHTTEIMANGEIIDTVTLVKEHKGQADDLFEGQTNTDYARFYVPQGSKLLSAIGFDDLPEGRQFLTATSGVDIDPDLFRLEKNLQIDEESKTRIVDEFGKTSFGNWITVASGETKKVMIKYLLPWRFEIDKAQVSQAPKSNLWSLLKKYFGIKQKSEESVKNDYIYGLLIQKQPGSNGTQITSTLKIDDRWTFGEYLPKEGIEVDNNILKIEFDLDSDKYYGVVVEEK